MKEKMKIDSLKKKTILFIFIITILCIVGSSLIASKVVEKQMTDKYRADKETAAGIISHSLAPRLDVYDYKQVEHLTTSFLGYANITSVTVFDADGTLIRSAVERNVSAEDLDMEKREITTSMRGIIGSVEIGFSKKYIHKQIRTMTVALIFGLMGFFVIVGSGIYAFMSRSIIEPLESFTKTVKEMNFENLSARVKISRDDEIGVLADSFNQMAGDLEESHRALRESEERYRLLFQNIPVGLFRNTPGPEGKWIMANPAIARIFGYETVREFFQTSVVDSYDDPAGRQGFSEKLLARGHVVGEELRLNRRDGITIWVAVTADAVRNESGEVEYFDGMVEDITERKQAGEARQKAHDELEAKVEERTKNLKEKTEKFERMNKLFVDRELRMKELKEEIKELKRKMR
ncbi:MAG: PAS domain S-box protein [Deltaproteobacteria bacterium]|nr:PAS domain S-box protein [Deltaproteobacteria bacterium]MBW2596026.1 PAS domain S-box protein [Deltaproteobacteria bacterium]